MSDVQTTIRLAVAHNLRDAIAFVMERSASFSSPVLIAAANDRTAQAGGAAQVVQSLVQDHQQDGSEVPIVTSASLTSLAWQRIRKRRDLSVEIDLRGRGGQLPSMRITTAIATATSLIAVNDLRGDSDIRPTMVIGMWGEFTDVRDRMGFRLSTANKGVAAEIALAVRPSMIVLVDRWRDNVVAIASSDQIAAELAGLALRQVIKSDEDEAVGPWEDPLVQRATELDLGVLLPDQIAIEGIVGDGADAVRHESVAMLADAIALKMGVATVSVSDRSR